MALFLAVLLLVSSLVSCGGSPEVMAYNGVSLPENVYRYWLACYRAQFAYEDNGQNTAALEALAINNIKKTLVCVSLFDSYGLVLDDTARTQIDAAMAKLTENAGGTRADLDRAAAVYGTDYDGLKTAVSYEQKASGLYNYLFGENGHFTLADAKYEEHMEKTYARVKMIYIPYTVFATDGDGMKIYDQATGGYVTVPKPDASLAIARERVAAVRQALSDGTDDAEFASLVSAYTEDPAAAGYENGYYFSTEVDYSDYLPGVPEAAAALENGECREIGNDTDGYVFLYRLPFAGGDWKDAKNADFFDGFVGRVGRFWFETLIMTYVEDVTVNEAVFSSVVYADVPENWELYW